MIIRHLDDVTRDVLAELERAPAPTHDAAGTRAA